MKNLIYFTIGLLILFNILKPEYIKVNQVEVNRCFKAMQQNPYLLCD